LSRQATKPPPDMKRVHCLDYPTEATTRNGTLITVETIAPDDLDHFFRGFIWPLGFKSIRAAWSRSGRAVDQQSGFDIDPDSSDIAPILKSFG
jgi:hypothetical protein